MIDWTPKLEDAICDAISVTPKGLEHICKANPTFPKSSAIYKYRSENTAFAEKYTRAKANQCMVLADQIVDIADDSRADTLIDEDGVVMVNREIIERCKIRIDARKWLAGKLAPKIYGDKTALTNANGDGPVKLIIEHIGSDGE